MMDKRNRARLFRERLQVAMAQAEVSRAGLARAVGLDRSTVSQVLAEGTTRLPGAQVVAEAAQALGVSADWLLGLSDLPETAQAVGAAATTFTQAPRALIDERVFDWHQEAAGYKIRTVPAGLPDMLKTRAMLEWESAPSLGRTAAQAIGASQDRLEWMRGARSDYEIAMPIHELRAFAGAEGYYAGLPVEVRREQIARFAQLHEQLFPKVRIHLYDARRTYSAPVTVFGPLIGVVYIGSSYMLFRDHDRVDVLTEHFDRLVRKAEVTDREWPAHLAQLTVA